MSKHKKEKHECTTLAIRTSRCELWNTRHTVYTVPTKKNDWMSLYNIYTCQMTFPVHNVFLFLLLFFWFFCFLLYLWGGWMSRARPQQGERRIHRTRTRTKAFYKQTTSRHRYTVFSVTSPIINKHYVANSLNCPKTSQSGPWSRMKSELAGMRDWAQNATKQKKKKNNISFFKVLNHLS